MKFGVLQFFSWPGRRNELTTVYQRALERIQIMDTNGFDAVWLAEHHFSTYSVCPSVHVMAMKAADITKNLRIGTAVSLAAFYHPLRLAEEVALLDHLTLGRINWGAGRGFDAKEMEVFGVERSISKERFHEHFEIVLQAWANETLTYEGKFNQFHDVEVLPKPLQNPMPFWVAGTSPDSVQWAGEQGYALLMDPHATSTELGNKYQLYQETLGRHNHVVDQDTPMARVMAIADTDEQAEQIAKQASFWMFNSYFEQTSGVPAEKQKETQERRLEDYVQNTVVWGCPERVADRLLELEETIPMSYLLAAPLSHRTFTHLVDDVIPRVM